MKYDAWKKKDEGPFVKNNTPENNSIYIRSTYLLTEKRKGKKDK